MQSRKEVFLTNSSLEYFFPRMSLQQYTANIKAIAPLQGESVKLTSLARSAHKALTPQQLVCTDDMRAAGFLVIFALATPLVKGEVGFFWHGSV